MNELNTLEVRQRRAHKQAQRPVAPAAKRYIATAELAQRRADKVAPASAPPGQIERLGLLDGIAGLLAPQLVQPLDVQMQQVAAEVGRRAVALHKLVDQPRLVVARSAAPQQPELMVGVPAATAQRLSKELVVAWEPVTYW